MRLTSLGHAGFLAETPDTLLVMDPWLSAAGAFDMGWFQLPRNHHMAEEVRARLRDRPAGQRAFVYVSHEHKDHFDPAFLRTLEDLDFEYVLPSFRRTLLVDGVRGFSRKRIHLLGDGQSLSLGGGDTATVFTDDEELNRDSAILFASAAGRRFFDVNDCKLHDRLGGIRRRTGPIDALAVQFSGATWHPTCYEYPEAEYRRIARRKRRSKFEATALAVDAVAPRAYLPSAGPPCFLDPDTRHLNFERVNIFPVAGEAAAWLRDRLGEEAPAMPLLAPGDTLDLDAPADAWSHTAPVVPRGEAFVSYIEEYAADYEAHFAVAKTRLDASTFAILRTWLRDEMQGKLDGFKSRHRIGRPLYFTWRDRADAPALEVDFDAGVAREVGEQPPGDAYRMAVYDYDIARVRDGHMTWEDYALTFRMRLHRAPDVYQVLMQGFLVLERDDLNPLCDKLLALEARSERMTVEAGGCRYRVDRFCPHQGADLREAWVEEGRYLVCPRHRWRFDLWEQGRCEHAGEGIAAVALEED